MCHNYIKKNIIKKNKKFIIKQLDITLQYRIDNSQLRLINIQLYLNLINFEKIKQNMKRKFIIIVMLVKKG